MPYGKGTYGRKKGRPPKKKKKMTQKELKESMPMFYDMEKELNAPMIELENMFKEWEKQLMDDLFN